MYFLDDISMSQRLPIISSNQSVEELDWQNSARLTDSGGPIPRMSLSRPRSKCPIENLRLWEYDLKQRDTS